MDKGLNNSKIAIILHDLRMGGAEHIMLQLAEALSKDGIPVDLILARAEGVLLSKVPPNVNVLNLDVNNPLAMLARVIKYLRVNRPKALLSPFEITSIVSILAKLLSRTQTKIVVRLSVALSKHKRAWFKKILERIAVGFFYRFADAIIAVSQGVAKDFSLYCGMPPNLIQVIYNPIISEKFIHDLNEVSTHPLLDDQRQSMVLGVGRLTEQKDFQTLVKAFDIVRKRMPVKLVILGDGEDRSSLEDLVFSLNLQDLAAFPGVILNPFQFMRKASVFVLSSKWEGLPGALIQALACDCPVVSTDCPNGPSEILDAGKYGHLVPVGDVDKMASAIMEVLNGDYRTPPETWMNQYRADVVVEQYKKVFGI